MNRFLSTVATAAFVAVLGTGAFAASTPAPMKASSMSSMSMKCATGKHYVHGYIKKDGTKVAGYCAADPKAAAKK
jgi:hypothetical protein